MDIINNSQFIFYGFIVLSVVTIILLGITIWLIVKMRKFLVGVNAKNIEDSLTNISNELDSMKLFRNELEKYLLTVEKRLKKSVQSVYTVRFNPFKGTGGGGNQSFATAFLNEDGNGVVVSSLYSRDHVGVFAKPVSKNTSEYGLSQEEKEAVENASKQLKE